MKNFYRYFQRGEHSPWIAVPDDGAERAARAEKAVRLTVLATSAQIGGLESEAVPKNLRFYGPLYFDIDSKKDLKLAIEAGNTLVKRLVEEYGMEENDISVFLSGSKGLHVFIDPVCFGFDRPIVRLPAVYTEMARTLYVSGMDMQVYSVRNAFRLVNIQRDDGNYRVQVSIQELRELTEERYRELVKAPRDGWKPPAKPNKQYAQLALTFEACIELAKKNERPIDDRSQVYAPVLRDTFKNETPPCMQAAAEGKVDDTKTFNQVAMQVAIFAARMSPDGIGQFQPLFDRIADNVESSAYDTSRARREHLEGQYQYMRNSAKMNFSCNAMRSVMKFRVCQDCPLEQVKVVETPEDAAKVVAIDVRGDGYFDESQKSPRRISTFTLHPDHIFSQMADDGSVRRVGTVAQVKSNGQMMGSVMLSEDSWNNRAAFLRSLNGLGNCSYLGSDSDLQKIKFVTMADNDLPEKTMVREMGLHITKATTASGEKEIRTYVEKGRSVNSLKAVDSFCYEGDGLYQPFLMSGSKVHDNDVEAREALGCLLQMNSMSVMGPLVGWCVACHLKPHLNHLYRQFPPLNLWGNSSTGKTTTAAYAMNLSGVDFITEHEEMNIPNSTPYAWLESLSNCTSVPVLWDEVNRSGERMTPRLYAKACELLKSCWNGQAANKGGLNTNGTGAVIRSYKTIRPVVYCSEQQPELPALVDRSLTLLLTKKGREGRREVLFRLRERLNGLKRLAFTMMLTALRTPTSEVHDRFIAADKLIPEGLSDRPRYGIACSLMGLQWLKEVCIDNNVLDDVVGAMLDEAIEATKEYAAALFADESTRQISTEVDRAMGEIFEIIDHGTRAMDTPGLGIARLQPGVHFEYSTAAGQSILFLDVRTAHGAYLSHMKHKGSSVILDDVRTFIKLAQQEDYVQALVKEEGVLDGRYALRIDLKAASRRGLPVEMLGLDHDW